jgi:aryl-alcohol dehydrogenase-like predicted oxidoreductase
MIDRLVLGTVQLGIPYGISNKTGKPDFSSACAIVKTAFDQGITRFDTAQAYGDSEEVLGNIFNKLKLGGRAKVYSKLHPGLDLRSENAVRQSVEGSLRKLKVDRLEGLLLHQEDGMRFWDECLGGALRKLVANGKVKLIGVSFYTPQRAIDVLDIGGIDIIQVPANILDRRFENAGVFKKAQERGKKVFVRSVFLQGLLLMPLDHVPASMRHALPYLERVEQMACDMKLSRQELVLGYAAKRWPGSSVLFGADSSKQVIDNVRSFSADIFVKVDENVFKNVPENVLNPALWAKP